jgi:hypothetical protein
VCPGLKINDKNLKKIMDPPIASPLPSAPIPTPYHDHMTVLALLLDYFKPLLYNKKRERNSIVDWIQNYKVINQ